jgi:hypothetical protein
MPDVPGGVIKLTIDESADGPALLVVTITLYYVTTAGSALIRHRNNATRCNVENGERTRFIPSECKRTCCHEVGITLQSGFSETHFVLRYISELQRLPMSDPHQD